MSEEKKPFNYDDHDLPSRDDYRIAAGLCHTWLQAHMDKMFNDKQIGNFMKDQPITAAKLLMHKTANPSSASIITALLGPAKFDMIDHPDHPKGAEYEAKARDAFGDDTVNLIRAMAGLEAEITDTVKRDQMRLFLVEGLSTMNDQLIGRKRIDPHHQTRWNILNELEKGFKAVKGQNPQIDELFEDALGESRAALEALDRAAAKKDGPKPK